MAQVASATPTVQLSKSLSSSRKWTILFIVSWMTLVVSYSSTCLFPAIDEIGAEFGVKAETINAANAGVLIAMGSSSFLWVPIANVSTHTWSST